MDILLTTNMVSKITKLDHRKIEAEVRRGALHPVAYLPWNKGESFAPLYNKSDILQYFKIER